MSDTNTTGGYELIFMPPHYLPEHIMPRWDTVADFGDGIDLDELLVKL